MVRGKREIMHQLIFLLSILTHPLNPLHKYHHHDTSLNDPSHGERRPKACSYTWNTKIQRTGEEPHLSTSQSLILMRTWEPHTAALMCVHLPLREAAGAEVSLCTSHSRAVPQQEPPCSDNHPTGSQWPHQLIPLTQKWGCTLTLLEAKSTNICND